MGGRLVTQARGEGVEVDGTPISSDGHTYGLSVAERGDNGTVFVWIEVTLRDEGSVVTRGFKYARLKDGVLEQELLGSFPGEHRIYGLEFGRLLAANADDLSAFDVVWMEQTGVDEATVQSISGQFCR